MCDYGGVGVLMSCSMDKLGLLRVMTKDES